jgi:hypothetical protein
MAKNTREQMKAERRRARRRPVLETFSLGAAIPTLGPHRLEVEDLSEIGIGIRVESEVFEDGNVPQIQAGELLELNLYLNRSLFIPLRLKVARVVEISHKRQILVGGDFEESSEGAIAAIESFLSVLDVLVDAVRMDPIARPQRKSSRKPSSK